MLRTLESRILSQVNVVLQLLVAMLNAVKYAVSFFFYVFATHGPAVEAREFPPPLSVSSQPNRLRQRTTTPHHSAVSTVSSDQLFAGLS